MKKNSVIALSMGDPAGIGPELIAALSYDEALLADVTLLCYGDKEALLAGYRALGRAPRFADAPAAGLLCLRPVGALNGHAFGERRAGFGRAQLSYFDAALEATIQAEADALCTAPITKALVDEEAGPFSGHTGYLCARLQTRAVMMLASDILRVSLVTEHIPLSAVAAALSVPTITETIVITAKGLQRDLGIARPRLAVAALNPHAGEGGLLGAEEQTLLWPAILEARAALKEGAELSAPLPADSLFTQAARARFDAVICLYHDQGLIPLKALSSGSAVNLSLGLPIVRSSPDHGTAYDIAGKGLADPASLRQAILLAAQIAQRRKASA